MLQLIPFYLHDRENIEEAQQIIAVFVERYNTQWLWLFERHGYLAPTKARRTLLKNVA